MMLSSKRDNVPSTRSAARRRRSREADSLFLRWLLLVYVPLLVLFVSFILFIARVISGWAVPILVILSAWGVVALRLIFERRRVGLDVPIPRSFFFAVGSVAGLGMIGGFLAWIGLTKASSGAGVALLFLGGFLMLVAVFAPAFKLVDVTLRSTGRLIGRRSGRRKR